MTRFALAITRSGSWPSMGLISKLTIGFFLPVQETYLNQRAQEIYHLGNIVDAAGGPEDRMVVPIAGQILIQHSVPKVGRGQKLLNRLQGLRRGFPAQRYVAEVHQ